MIDLSVFSESTLEAHPSQSSVVSVSLEHARPPTARNSVPLTSSPRLLLQTPHGLLKSLRLPFNWYLIDMFLPERHLLAVLHPNPVLHSIRVSRDAPEGAVFDLGDLEVDGFGAQVFGILYDDADDAGGKEVAHYLGWKDGTTPGGDGVLSDWGEGAGHGGESGGELCFGGT